MSAATLAFSAAYYDQSSVGLPHSEQPGMGILPHSQRYKEDVQRYRKNPRYIHCGCPLAQAVALDEAEVGAEGRRTGSTTSARGVVGC